MGQCNPTTNWRRLGGRGLVALAGLIIALVGSSPLKWSDEEKNVLAWVNQQAITAEQLAFVAQRLSSTGADSLSEQQRQAILELLVDEELLLQRAQTLGMYSADPGIRKALAHAVIDRVEADFIAMPVDERQLREFYSQHQAVFTRPMRMAVQALRFSNIQDAQRVLVAVKKGADFSSSSNNANNGNGSNVADGTLLSHLPSTPLPIHMLRRYLGATLTDVALQLAQGEVSDPIQRPDGVYLLRARVVQPEKVQAFVGVREQVKSEYRRRGRDWALETTFANLWDTSEIHINPKVTEKIGLSAARKHDLSELTYNQTNHKETY